MTDDKVEWMSKTTDIIIIPHEFIAAGPANPPRTVLYFLINCYFTFVFKHSLTVARTLAR